MVNFISRSWDKNAKKRYDNCPNEESLVNIKKMLYNYDNVIGEQKIIIVEGCFDCIKVKSVFSEVVAVCGTEVSLEQKRVLINLKAKNYYVMFDADTHITSTSKKAQDLANYLSAFAVVKVINLPSSKDPGDLTKEEIKGILEKYGIN